MKGSVVLLVFSCVLCSIHSEDITTEKKVLNGQTETFNGQATVNEEIKVIPKNIETDYDTPDPDTTFDTSDIQDHKVNGAQDVPTTTESPDERVETNTPEEKSERIVVVAAGAGGAAAPVVIPIGTPDVHYEVNGEGTQHVQDTTAEGSLDNTINGGGITNNAQMQDAKSDTLQDGLTPDTIPEVTLSDPESSEFRPPVEVRDGSEAASSNPEITLDLPETITVVLDSSSSLESSVPLQASPPTLAASTDELSNLAEPLTVTPSAAWDGLGGRVVDVSPPGSTEPIKEDEDFPTFDKWSVQYLKEQEKQKEEKELEPLVIPSQKKLRQNFALASCGAKILASNAEAEHANYLLNGNPDEYMISPCKAKKWFVVELCEPVQIHKVDLGTVELFSSPPKSFKLSASQRYPTKEWIPLGQYELTPERVVQTFPTQLLEEFPYVKFVRVDLLEHHGHEHYCPITTFRVFGLDFASDDDEEDTESFEADGPNELVVEEMDEIEESVNLFKSAKDTVVKLVKKVLYKGEDEPKEPKLETDNQTVTENNTIPNADEMKGETEKLPCLDKGSADTQHGEPVQLDDGQLKTNVGEGGSPIQIDDSGQAIPADSLSDLGGQSPESSQSGTKTPEMNIELSQGESKQGKKQLEDGDKPEEVPIVTKLDDTEQLPPQENLAPVVVKLEPEGVELSPSEKLCVRHTVWYQLQDWPFCSIVPKKEEKIESVKDIVEDDIEVSAVTSDLPIKESQTVEQLPDEILTTPESSQLNSKEVTTTYAESLEPSSHSLQADQENESSLTPGLDIQQSRVVEQEDSDLGQSIFLKVSPSPTSQSDDSGQDVEYTVPETPGASEIPSPIEKETPVIEPKPETPTSGESPDSSKPANDGAANNASEPISKQTVKPELVKLPPPSAGKRDTSILKLSNRIVSLEQNVSMAKRYLEELSKAFKQQNEEMMKLLNKTVVRLNTHVSWAEEKNSERKSDVEHLEEKVMNLTQVVVNLQDQVDTLSQQLGDRQMLLVTIQIIMFLWLVLAMCRRGRKHESVTDHQFLLDTMPRQPVVLDSGHRRNSDGGLGTVALAEHSSIKRQTSETNLVASVEDQSKSFLHGSMTQLPKKKKKKKVKILPEQQPSVQQSASFSSWAGVLFVTSPDSDKSDKENAPSLVNVPYSVSASSFSDVSGCAQARPLVRTQSLREAPRCGHACYSGNVVSALQQEEKLSLVIPQGQGTSQVEEAVKISPEFTLPTYHRNKLRKLGGRPVQNWNDNATHGNSGNNELYDYEWRGPTYFNPDWGSGVAVLGSDVSSEVNGLASGSGVSRSRTGLGAARTKSATRVTEKISSGKVSGVKRLSFEVDRLSEVVSNPCRRPDHLNGVLPSPTSFSQSFPCSPVSPCTLSHSMPYSSTSLSSWELSSKRESQGKKKLSRHKRQGSLPLEGLGANRRGRQGSLDGLPKRGSAKVKKYPSHPSMADGKR